MNVLNRRQGNECKTINKFISYSRFSSGSKESKQVEIYRLFGGPTEVHFDYCKRNLFQLQVYTKPPQYFFEKIYFTSENY